MGFLPIGGTSGSLILMCGRYATTRGTADLSALFDALEEDDYTPLPPDYNVAPTDPVPIVRTVDSEGARRLAVARWGLLPHWAKDPRSGARMINARAETVATSSAFASSFARRRCLIPADGWYEWLARPDGGRKQAYFMTPRDGSVLAFGGIWAPWGTTGQGRGRGVGRAEPDRSFRLTCSIVTMVARGPLAAVHDRMPLVLPADRWAGWLGGPADPEFLLAPPVIEFLEGIELRPVGPAVGDVRNDGPDLVARLPGVPEPGRSRLRRVTADGAGDVQDALF
jgi:putative SOS response-associated peptidase YedK